MSKKNKRRVSRTLANYTPKTVEFDPDYSTIKQDLKRIGVLAGTFIAILVVLAIFQNQLLGAFLK